MMQQTRGRAPRKTLSFAVCLALLALPLEGATTTVIDSSAAVAFPSIKVGGDGLGLVAYYDQDNHDLKVAHCNDLACTSATLTVLDSYGDVGQDASLAMGTDGLGLIAYLNYTDFKLKTAHCSNAACTSATITTHGDASGAVSMVRGTDGRGLITYSSSGGSYNGLRVAHCNDVACTSLTSAPLAERFMPYTSMAVGADGLALVGIIDSITDRLEVAHCANVACTSATLTEIDVADCHTWPTRPLALAVGPDGLGLVAYSDGSQALRVAHCLDAACTSASTTTVKTGLNGQDVGFDVDACRLGLVAYTYDNGLVLAHCGNGACSRAWLRPLDTAGLTGGRSVTIGSDGVPLVAYFTYEGFYEPHFKVAYLDPWPLPTKGDFDGDGQVDLVFRNATTDRAMIWLMNGAARKAATWIAPDPPGPAWRTAAVDDFDSAASPGAGPDGQSDLVLHNSASGEVQFWLMSGSQRVGPAVALSGGPAMAAPWQLAASGDFNDDGRPDLLWRNGGTQKLLIWTMNKTARIGDLVPTPDQAVDGNWVVAAALDLNGDLNRDLLWYNSSSGKIVHWWLNANAVRIAGLFNTPSNAGHANWSVQAGGDFGVATGGVRCSKDIVWRNATSGKNVVWWENFAATRTAGGFTVPDAALTDPDGVPTPATDWLLVGPK